MNTFVVEIVAEGELATIYSVRKEEVQDAEFYRFMNKIEQEEGLAEPFQILSQLIFDTIADKFGALSYFFNRFEAGTDALPPSPGGEKRSRLKLIELNAHLPNFPLRLYCMRVSDEILILFNGGAKSTRTTQEDGWLEMKRKEGVKFSRKIQEALREDDLLISRCGFYLEDSNGEREDICIF